MLYLCAIPAGLAIHLAKRSLNVHVDFGILSILGERQEGERRASSCPPRLAGRRGQELGLLDDFRLYTRTLSQAEVRSDMNTPVSEGNSSSTRH